MKMEPLTENQASVYRFMVRFLAKHQRMPTFRETMIAAGYNSPNAVNCHLKPLIKKGYVIKDPTNHCHLMLPYVEWSVKDTLGLVEEK